MKKDIALLIVIVLAAAAVIKGVDIQSVDEYYDGRHWLQNKATP